MFLKILFGIFSMYLYKQFRNYNSVNNFIDISKYYLRVTITISLFVIILPAKLQSQGTYYWNQNYGTRSNILGGQVIGSVEDITAVYYNPG